MKYTTLQLKDIDKFALTGILCRERYQNVFTHQIHYLHAIFVGRYGIVD